MKSNMKIPSSKRSQKEVLNFYFQIRVIYYENCAKIQLFQFTNIFSMIKIQMEKNLSTSDKTQAYEFEIDQNQNFPTFDKLNETVLESDETSKKEESFNSMEKFCFQFCKDYFDKANQVVTIQELTQKYGVKNRRVYDLMGILEGFSFLCKIKKKGTYMWLSVRNNGYHYHFQERKSVALKDIAALLKLLLINCKQGLAIKELNEKIIFKIQEQTKRQQCKLTITRRIYQCLKVMKIFGMVQKHDCLFRTTVCRIKKPISWSQNRTSEKEKITKTQKKVLKRVMEKVGSQKLQNIIINLSKK